MRRGAPSDDEEDAALVTQAIADTGRGFHELYRRHVDTVFARLTRILGPVPERDDIMQQVFLDVHRALPSFRGEAKFSTFLHRIVVRRACRHLRGRRATAPLGPQHLDELIAPGLSPEATAGERQKLARALELLARLKPKKRIAFVLCVVEGLSLADAAELVGAKPDAVKKRVLHARQELLAMIEARDDGRERGDP